MRTRGGLKARFAALVAMVLVVTGATTVVAEVTSSPRAAAVVGSQFDPGNIISDAYFFDPNAMSEAQIQAFLDAKIGSCLNSLCLNVLRVNTTNQPAEYTSWGNLVCGAYVGAANERASAIIFKVQQACRVSAKVLLVTLQKEQGLVTKRSPTEGTLERAMGYGCPDNNGGVCAEQYYGFFNQMVNAAWQLQRYGTAPVFGTFQPGARSVQWHPNAACGASTITIANRATAALYNYTPYRPNAAALNNLYGTGDGCSSYGNRNFWVYYNDWFGSSTQPPGTPEGNLAVTPGPGAITLSGWAVDPDAVTSPVTLSIQLDSGWSALYANQVGEDLSSRYSGAGSQHAFSGSIPASPGGHTLCVYLVNAGGAGGMGTMGCQTVIVPDAPSPIGAITEATASGRTVTFSGWAVAPDRPTAPLTVALNHGSNWTAIVADKPNSIAPTAVAGAGPNQGFTGSFTASPGVQTFCVWATRTTGGAVNLGCRTLLVPDTRLTEAVVESANGSSGAVTINGWAVWPAAPSESVPVALNIGANWYAFSANLPSSSAATAVPGAGPDHGFSASVAMPPGAYNACAWAAQQGAAAIMIGCRTVTVAASPTGTEPQAVIESVTADASGVSVSGWAAWPSSPTSSVPVAVNIGPNWYALSANQPSASAETALPGIGPNHGYAGTIPAPQGQHTVCIWIAKPAGGATQVGCQSVTVAAASGPNPLGEILVASGGVGGVHFEGWALAPADPTAPITLAANIGGNWSAITANEPNAVAGTKFSGAGPNQGFSGLFPAPVGTHQFCIWASTPSGPVRLACNSATVGPAPSVAGGITEVVAGAGTITLNGWAVAPSSLSTPLPVAANVGSNWTALTSGIESAATAKYVLGGGPNQGFSGTVAAPSGKQTVCIWAAPPNGAAIQLGCTSVTVP